ncbi:unnamed protein product [Bemisia tabaci]|uniref:Uncharacterized protein n=1 Tax=Bemisia tabaci TaxID=7038 RepID=A0A9P0A628_BEMTA|nr:PREDICTED: uncharacterized protein LOC109035664 [Bemisia tabaci]CAH0384699.1 unnamed protein product [Bemisia tabaci]
MPFSSSSVEEKDAALRCFQRLYGIPASPPKPLPPYKKKKNPNHPTTSDTTSHEVLNIISDIANSAQSGSIPREKMPNVFGVTDLRFELIDEWQMFIERLELMFISQNVEKDKQVPELLTRVSAETYSIIRDLSIPQKPSELKFDKLVKLVEKHLEPPSSELARRHKFVTVEQNTNESLSDFIARLKKSVT